MGRCERIITGATWRGAGRRGGGSMWPVPRVHRLHQHAAATRRDVVGRECFCSTRVAVSVKVYSKTGREERRPKHKAF